ncbi:ABC transporter substrate-binding protein [Dongia deserti]|uniref:ABC transporter substrate-binding protein n=1 Tax=Dongia deserti TaxID=2268030 RepID=UPI0013C3F9BC|nr:extracellular solute-binding protein [Dongia deserti]
MTKKIRLDRRDFLIGSTAAGAMIAAPTIVRAASKELRVLTWEGYAEPEWVDAFKKDTGAEVKIVYVGSADEMFAKMQGSQGADFDVVSFDTSIFSRYIDANLLAPLDLSKIANAGNIAPEFREVKEIMRADKQFGVPFAWGSLPMVYDADVFPTPPESWEVMWNPEYAQQLICMDDANNCITWGALVAGVENPYNLSDDDFARVKAKLIEQKKLLLSYFAGFDEGVNMFAQNSIKVMYSMGEPQVPALKKKGINAALTIPREGAPGWLDCWTMSVGATDPDLAHQWINNCLAAAVGDILTNKAGYGNTTNTEVNKAAGFTYGDKLSWLQQAENYEKRVAVWNEVKAG